MLAKMELPKFFPSHLKEKSVFARRKQVYPAKSVHRNVPLKIISPVGRSKEGSFETREALRGTDHSEPIQKAELGFRTDGSVCPLCRNPTKPNYDTR